jgi:multiple sugar transport system substrate-binding protein
MSNNNRFSSAFGPLSQDSSAQAASVAGAKIQNFNFNAGLTRRGFLVGGAGTALALALAACTASGGSSSGSTTAAGGKAATLSVWLWANGPATATGLNNAAKTSSDLKNVTVSNPVVAASDYAVAQKLSLALSAHSTLPDIVYLNYTEVPEFAATGALADISDVVGPVSSDLYSGAKAIASYQGKDVAFPQNINSKLFYYRADLFEQAGIDATSIKTSDDFIEAGKKFHAKFPKQYIMNVNTQPPQYVFGEQISAYAPITFADKNGKYLIESNPAYKEVLTFMRELKTSGIAYPVDDFTTDWPGAIKNEYICGFLSASWMSQFLPSYAGTAQTGKWKTIPWPTLSPLQDQKLGSDAGGSVMVVPKGAPHEAIAIELLRQARFTQEGSKAYQSATGASSVLKSAQDSIIADAKKSTSSTDQLATNLKFFGADYITEQFNSFDNARAFGYDPQATKEWNSILPNWLNKTMTNSGSIESILAGLQSDLTTQVGNPYK